MAFENFLKSSLISGKTVLTYVVILLITGVFLWLINFFNISYPLSITNHQGSGDLSVVGEGKVDITPDTASVDLGIISNDASSVEAAQTEINTVNNAIVESVTKLGIDKADIKTSNYSINPNYSFDGGRNEITGYNGNATVSIKVRDISKLPEVINAATAAGANQVMGTNYTVDKPEEYREKARDAAIANAKEQANKLADQLGIRLGKITNVVESTSGSQPPIYYERSMALDSAGGSNLPSPDLQPGTQTITSTVTLYFEKR